MKTGRFIFAHAVSKASHAYTHARECIMGVVVVLLLLLALAEFPVPSVDCQSRPQSNYLFCNPKLSPEERATDLVSRLSLEELVNQTSSIAPAIPRLGINAYNWRSNCLHGWSKSGGPNWLGYYWTVFPAQIGLAATFDTNLVLKAGQVTSTEGRALHNEVMSHYNGSSVEASGLNCLLLSRRLSVRMENRYEHAR